MLISFGSYDMEETKAFEMMYFLLVARSKKILLFTAAELSAASGPSLWPFKCVLNN